MALLDFPSGPGTGDTYTLNGNTWKWNGTSWTAFNSLSLSSQVTGILAVQYGGTGFGGTYTKGDVLYALSSNTFGKLSAGTAGSVLSIDINGDLYWKKDDAGSGTVGSGNVGGLAYYTSTTNITSGTAFSYLNGSGAGGTGATVVITQSSLALIGSTITSGEWKGTIIGVPYGGTGLNSITAGQIIYGSGTNAYSALSYPGAGYALTTVGSTVAWITFANMSVGAATTATTAGSAGTSVNAGFAGAATTATTAGSAGTSVNAGFAGAATTSVNSGFAGAATTATTAGSAGTSVNAGFAGAATTATTAGSAGTSVNAGFAGAATTSVNSGFAGAATTATTAGSAGTSVNAGFAGAATTATNAGLAGAATNLAGGSTGALHYQTGASTSGFLNHPGAAGQALTTSSTNALAWTSLSNVAVTSIAGASNQITVSAATGSVTVSLPSTVVVSDIQLNGTSSTLSNVGPSGTSIVNKQYVDNLASGLDIHASVRVVLASAIGGSYYHPNYGIGSTGIGAYITSIGNSDLTAQTFDGKTLAANQRVLITAGLTATGKTSFNGSALVTPSNSNIVNGIYTVGSVGSGSSQWYLYRATDTDDSIELTGGTFVFVEEGNTYADSGWVCTNDTTNLGPIQFGSTPITWSQFSGAAAFSSGQGLNKVGSTFATKVNLTSTGVPSGTGFTQFNIGGAGDAGVADTGYYPTFSVRTSGPVSGTSLLTLNSDGFSLIGSTNTPRTLSISGGDVSFTGQISIGNPGAAGRVPYSSDANTLSFLANPGSGYALTTINSTTIAWIAFANMSVGSATTATNAGFAGAATTATTAGSAGTSVNAGFAGAATTATTAGSAGTSVNAGFAGAATTATNAGFAGAATTATSAGIAYSAATVNTAADTSSTLYLLGSRVSSSTASTQVYVDSNISISGVQVTAGVWAGTAISLTNGGTNNTTASGNGFSSKVAVYNVTGTAITALTHTQGHVLFGATGGTYASIASTNMPVVAIGSSAPALPSGLGGTQPGQLWWDSEYGVLKVYYTDATPTSQWVDATPVLGSSGGGSASKRSYVMSFGAGFTPSTGADTVQILVPYAPDNSSKYYYIKRLDYRNETAGTGASFYIERYTGGVGTFNITSSGNRIYSAAGTSFVVGSGIYITSYTLASSGASFVSSTGVASSIMSGDYLRLNFTHINNAATMSISMIIEEQ